ncbi:MAG TPA: patatin-like phospholipase family protein [Puia sp.]|nr:patatin-like phospholipase family protein [Puia sp.]
MTIPTEIKKRCKILCLDGGGAKGFYSLGVLREIEGMAGKRLYEVFDLVFGTSTGSIIAALIAQGHAVDDMHRLYQEHVPRIMKRKRASEKTRVLAELADEVFGDAMFGDVKTGVGIVTTKWIHETPMIFKGSVAQAHGQIGTFVPGFGVRVSDAVQASCAAFPFFERKIVHTANGDYMELVDGGYCANNPTLYAIADATRALKFVHEDLRVVSIGVGKYPDPKRGWFSKTRWANYLLSVQLLQKTLEINTQSMEQLRTILYRDVPTVRISDTFSKPEMATDLFEHDLTKLNILRQQGVASFAKREPELQNLLT